MRVPPPSLAEMASVTPLEKRMRAKRSSDTDASSNSKLKDLRVPQPKSEVGQYGFTSTADSLALIGRFHTLNKRLEQNKRNALISEDERKRVAALIQQEKEDLGGIQRYQEASMFGAMSGRFVCARWVEPILRLHFSCSSRSERNQGTATPSSVVSSGPRSILGSSRKSKGDDAKPSTKRVRILDVGAIDNQYLGYTWFDAVAIDLNDSTLQSEPLIFLTLHRSTCCRILPDLLTPLSKALY